LDVGMKDISFLEWCPQSALLAVGTSKGSVALVNVKTLQRTASAARHRKRIVCGAWNSRKMLAYASEDNEVGSVSVCSCTCAVCAWR
jgi:WD repeat-containing protein 19